MTCQAYKCMYCHLHVLRYGTLDHMYAIVHLCECLNRNGIVHVILLYNLYNLLHVCNKPCQSVSVPLHRCDVEEE